MFGDHPRTLFPWWPVPYVLPVPALQVRHPISVLIQMKTNNLPLQALFPNTCYGSPNEYSVEPAATTTYCFPSTEYVIGDEYTLAPH